MNQIAARAHFIVLLTPSALERVNEPGDWLRREIEHALDNKRNIVPLMFEGFSFNDARQYLTGKLSVLPSYNSMTVTVEYFEAAMQKLSTQFLNIPLNVVLHPAPASDDSAVKQVQSDAAQQPPPSEKQQTAEEFLENGNLRLRNEDYDAAIDDYTEAIRLNSQYVDAYNNRGIARKLKGDYDGAMADYDEAIRLNPQLAALYNNRGNTRNAKGDHDGAITDYNEAIRLNPQDAAIYDNRHIAYKDKGDLKRADADYRKYLELRGADDGDSFGSRE